MVVLQMNEEVTGQLHVNTMAQMDVQANHILALEREVEGLMTMNHQLVKNYNTLGLNMEKIQMQSVMYQALLTHYAESHWEPIVVCLGRLESMPPVVPSLNQELITVMLSMSHLSLRERLDLPVPLPSPHSNHLPLPLLNPSTTPPPSYQQCQACHQSHHHCSSQRLSQSTSLKENLPLRQRCMPCSQQMHNHLEKLSKERSLKEALQEFHY